MAIALSDMVELEYLSLDEANEIAYTSLFSNANEFHRLEHYVTNLPNKPHAAKLLPSRLLEIGQVAINLVIVGGCANPQSPDAER